MAARELCIFGYQDVQRIFDHELLIRRKRRALAAAVPGAAFLLDRAVTARTADTYPWGITVVNLSGSLLIGVLTGLAQSSLISAPWLAVLGVGLIGGYTTFSSVTVEVALSLSRRDYRAALLHGGAQLVIAVALAALGMGFGGSL